MSFFALAPLQNRDFRFLLSGFAIGQMLISMQFVTPESLGAAVCTAGYVR